MCCVWFGLGFVLVGFGDFGVGGFPEFRVWVWVVVSCGLQLRCYGCVSSAGAFLRF